MPTSSRQGLHKIKTGGCGHPPLRQCNEKNDLYMKTTGIVRRIDDLGRVVIPKEIRRTMRIREGVLGCRLGQCFCFAEVSTGHPHPVTDNIDSFRAIFLIIVQTLHKKKQVRRRPKEIRRNTTKL